MTTSLVKKNKGGRPTKYRLNMLGMIDDYVNECCREQTELPTIEGLAGRLGVNTDTVYEWEKKYPKFSDALKKLRAKQKNQLINDGMYGGKEVNATMAIFLLKANHKLVDTPQVVQQFNVKEGGGLQIITTKNAKEFKKVNSTSKSK